MKQFKTFIREYINDCKETDIYEYMKGYKSIFLCTGIVENLWNPFLSDKKDKNKTEEKHDALYNVKVRDYVTQQCLRLSINKNNINFSEKDVISCRIIIKTHNQNDVIKLYTSLFISDCTNLNHIYNEEKLLEKKQNVDENTNIDENNIILSKRFYKSQKKLHAMITIDNQELKNENKQLKDRLKKLQNAN